jgi:dimethylhistidine N-methyltransferase
MKTNLASATADYESDMQVTFHDHKPRELSFLDAVIDGLSQDRKTIPPKFFYDERGSQLFDAICKQPEYYLPKVERELLRNCIDEIAQLCGSGRVIIEPGAGRLIKIRLLLDKLQPSAFVPMDISGQFLKSSMQELALDYPLLSIHAACVDFTHSMPVPESVPDVPRLVFFPGSSLGNFHHGEAVAFLRMVHETLDTNGMLLIGVDTKKPTPILHAAYNDEAGVTAQFNLNLLRRINNELDADIDTENFDHHAYYNSELGRIEMHLVSRQQQQIRIDDHKFAFSRGESVHTECSYKYTPDEFLSLAAEAGLSEVKHWLAKDRLFCVYLLEAE